MDPHPAAPPGSAAQADDEQLLASARRALSIEARAVEALTLRLGPEFAHACRICLGCRGRVVVTGMGKSGHVAGKIAATLASTGTPAFFLHPAEAGHGDLGMITRLDAVLAKGTVEPEERAPGVYRFKLDVAPKATASLPVEEIRVLRTNYQIADLNDEQIAVFSKNGTISPELTEALRKISAQKATVARLEQEMEDLQKDIDRIVADQARLRENMKALKGSPEEEALLQRYTRELNDQEDKLGAARREIDDLSTKRAGAKLQLDKMLQNVTLDEAI